MGRGGGLTRRVPALRTMRTRKSAENLGPVRGWQGRLFSFVCEGECEWGHVFSRGQVTSAMSHSTASRHSFYPIMVHTPYTVATGEIKVHCERL